MLLLEAPNPTSALVHWRSVSMKFTAAIGTPNRAEAARTKRSKRSSRGVSRIPTSRSAATRRGSDAISRIPRASVVDMDAKSTG
ncbi:hypothetical protein [Sinomonas sp.]|uniref:hypothetical protein n=1 Tax=Sinomonas sp. TaxID=1914986 RepID=UPI003F82030B